ncbi:hypothetical protein GCM10027290_50510 [Micromonospora sonneratiae]|uniref:Glycosyltransferase n=1 Tax=Micromonospora sonneratiae TaxID=1184706 RepID=A0ABW3Y9T4_9ACTN
MSSQDTTQRYLRWRVVVGDRNGRWRRRGPVSLLGAGVTQVPAQGSRRSGPRPGDRVYRMVVAAQSVDWLRHLLTDPASLVEVTRVSIIVESWSIPQGGWSGRLGPLTHVLFHRLRLPRVGQGRAVVEIGLEWPRQLRKVITAVLPLLTPVRPMPHPASADITAQDVIPDWLGTAQNDAVVTGALTPNEDVRPYDIVLTATGAPQPPVEPDQPAEAEQAASAVDYGTILAADAYGAGFGARPETVLVDLEHVTVGGRYGPFGPSAGRAQLAFTNTADGRGWQITGPKGVLCSGRIDRPWLSPEARAALDEIGTVHCAAVPARYPIEEAAFLVHLVLSGVLVHVPDLPPAVSAYLADEVRDLVTAPLPDQAKGDLEWEIRTVAQRRAAMRQHATGLVLPRLASAAFPALAEPPSVSVVLVTKRFEYIFDVLDAIEAQTYPNLEIVLCLHGVEPSPSLQARVARSPRPIELVSLPAGHGFGEAIGVATARSRGTLVTKFDDDDTYGPEHVWDLVLARHHSGAALVGKGAEFVYLQALDTTVRRDVGRTEVYVSVVAGGTMLISRGDLEQVGGWRPVSRSIDRGLIDRIRRSGGLIYRTHPLGYVYHRRSDGHTWDPGSEYFLRGTGVQWTGLPRHYEFGTAPASSGRPGDAFLIGGTGSSAVSLAGSLPAGRTEFGA